MSKPYIHALSSAKKFGGNPEEYLKYHEWFDQSKAHFSDVRHRALLHTTFGIYLFQQMFGETITISTGKVISTRDIGEQHVLEDYSNKFIPTVQDFLSRMDVEDWMINGTKGYPISYERVHKKINQGSQKTSSKATRGD